MRVSAIAAAALLGGCGPSLATETGQSLDVALDATSSPKDCSFNRISISPGGSSIVAWTDHRPNALYPGTFARRSEIALIDRTTAPRFFDLEGEVSALNWRSQGDRFDFLLSGRTYGLVDAGKPHMRLWRIDPAWARINVKSVRWDALRKAIDEPEIGARLNQAAGKFSRFSGVVLLDGHTRIIPAEALVSQSAEGLPIVSVFEQGSPLVALAETNSVGTGQSLSRPIFAAESGAAVGSQDLQSLRMSEAGKPASTETAPAPGTILKDAVRTGNRTALLLAAADGRHIIELLDEGIRAASVTLCDASENREPFSEAVALTPGQVDLEALFHRSATAGHSKTLAIRFHGGPFTSLGDSFPSNATRKMILRGIDVLDVEGVGSRTAGADLPGPLVTPANYAKLGERIAAWALRQPYRDIVVLGESFGAIAAVDLALRLEGAAKDGRGGPATRMILVSPLTRLASDRTMSGLPLVPGTLQAMAEERAFGHGDDRSTLSAWVASRMSAACGKADLAIFVGSKDDRTSIAGQEPCMRRRATILKGADHVIAVDDPRVWQWLD